MFKIINADCAEALKGLPGGSVDAVVTDPPYGLKFMGKKWDHSVPSVEVWAECLRVLKPGGYLLCFAGTRTHHRMCCNIEDAGFEVRDMIAWVYGSGFPKSHNLKDDWQGWGTALKPALEPITMARNPFPGTVAQNVLDHGTGAINVDGCRVVDEVIKTDGRKCGGEQVYNGRQTYGYDGGVHTGRWPANLIHDGLQEEWSRYFYCPKASKKDREDGCEGMEAVAAQSTGWSGESMPLRQNGTERKMPMSRNHHPTVKPTDLMRYLCRLVTPPGGLVLDPFMGSGSTGKAAILEGFRFIGIEREIEYIEIARARIQKAMDTKGQEAKPTVKDQNQ